MSVALPRERIRAADWAQSTAAQVVAVALISVLAAGLRFYQLGAWSFWFDEVANNDRALAHYADLGKVARDLPRNIWLPLSLLLTGQTFNLLGVSEFSARLVPALIGIVSVPILYVPVRRLFDAGTGLIAALLLAVSPWHLYWSQNARFYSALMLLYTLALFAFFVALERDRPAYILAGYGFLYLAASERLVALFLVPVIAAYVLLLWRLPFERPAGFNRRNVALLALLPLGVLVAAEAFSLATSGSFRFLSADFFAGLGWFAQYRGSNAAKLIGHLSYQIGAALLALGFFAGLYLSSQRNRAGLLLLLSATLPIVLLLLMSLFAFTTDRYVFATLPSWLVLAAAGVMGLLRLARGKSLLLAAGVLALLLADAARLDLLYYTVNHGNRLDSRAALAAVSRESQADDRYISAWPALDSYYLGKPVQHWSSVELGELPADGRRVWFFIESEAGWGPHRQWALQNAALKDVYYLRAPYDTSLRIYLYDPGS